MKKWLAVFAFALLFAQQAEASEAEISKTEVDFSTGEICVSAQITDYSKYDYVSMTVFTPSKEVETIDSAKAADTVDFSFKIHESEDGKGGDYTVKITVSDGGDAEAKFYYAFLSERNQAVSSLFAENADIEGLVSDASYLRVIGVPEKLSENVEKSKVAPRIKAMLDNNEIEQNIASVQDAIGKVCIYEAFNQNKVSVLFSSDGAWEYVQFVDLSRVDTDGKAVYSYYQSMTASEKAEVKRLLGLKSELTVDSIADVYLEFSRAVMISSVNQNTSGWGFLRDMLEKNGEYVGLEISEYSALSDSQKDKADAYVLQNKASVTSLDAMQNVITNAVAYAKKDVTANQQHQSSHSGGGGGGAGLIGNTTAYTGITPGLTDEKADFTDMDNTHWAYDAVTALRDKGIIDGYSDESFKPGATITREAFIKLIMTAYSIECDTENPFSDVESEAWYEGYVGGAYKAGIITGDDKGMFGVGKSITRQDAAVILYRVSKIAENSDYEFSDSTDIAEYAKVAVNTLAARGIINGKDGNCFMPRYLLTRAEAAALLYRLLQL